MARPGKRNSVPDRAGRPRAAKADPAAPAARGSAPADAADYRRYLDLATEGIWRYEVRPAVRTSGPPEKQAEAILERSALVDCNAAFARLHGFERPEDMLGLPLSKLLAGSHDEQVRFIAQSIESGYRILDAESVTLDKQGRTVWTLNNVLGMVERGNLVGGWGSTRDITDRKASEAALRASEERLSLALGAASDGVYDVDLVTGETHYSPGYYTMLGFAPGEFAPSDDAWESLLHPDDRARAREMLARCLSGEVDEAETEFRLRTKAGGWRHIQSRGKVVQRDESGKALRFVGTHRDITAYWEASEALRHERDRARVYLDIAEVMLVALDPEGRVALINRKGCRLLGYEGPEALIGKDWFETCVPSDAVDEARTVFRGMIAGDVEPVEHHENRVVTKSGQLREMAWHNALLYDSEGKVVGTLSSGEDITERRRAEAAIRESELKYRLLVETASEAVFVAQDGVLKFANPATAKILGRSLEEVSSRPFPEFIHPDDRAMVSERHARRLTGENVETGYAFRVLHADGTVRWVELNAVRLEWDGRPATLNFVTDITERTLAEEALEESEERFRKIFAESPLGVVSCDSGFRFTRVNRAFCHMLGYAEDELLSRSFADITHPDHVAGDIESVTRLLRGEIPLYRTEKRYVRKDGGVLWASTVVSALRDAHGRFLHFVGMIEDITTRKSVEAELVDRERRYRELANDLPTCVFEADPEGRLTFANRTGLDWFGYSAQEIETGTTVFDMVAAEQRDRAVRTFGQALGSGSVPTGEYTAIRKDGSTFPALISSRAIVKDGRPVGIRGILIDISERVEAARRVQNALSETIHALAVTTEMRDPYTAGHQERVTQLACAIGQEMGLSEDRLEGLRVAGILHDVGKVSVPAEILSKPTVLTPTEFGLVKIHPESGYEILRAIHFPWPVAEIVLQHHERMDGSGYPKGIRDDAILLEARILGVADVVEAIVSHRPYRPARPMAAAVEDVARAAGTLYDAEVVAACKRLFERGALPLMG